MNCSFPRPQQPTKLKQNYPLGKDFKISQRVTLDDNWCFTVQNNKLLIIMFTSLFLTQSHLESLSLGCCMCSMSKCFLGFVIWCLAYSCKGFKTAQIKLCDCLKSFFSSDPSTVNWVKNNHFQMTAWIHYWVHYLTVAWLVRNNHSKHADKCWRTSILFAILNPDQNFILL